MAAEQDTSTEADDSMNAPAKRRGVLAHPWRYLTIVAFVFALLLTTVGGFPAFPAFGSMLMGLLVFRFGWFFLQAFATPAPPPPEPGTLRKVKLTYRCEICGAEVRMTVSPAEDPEPPRHCLDEMTLVTPVD